MIRVCLHTPQCVLTQTRCYSSPNKCRIYRTNPIAVRHFAVLQIMPQLMSVCAYNPRIRLDVIEHIVSGSSAHVDLCLSTWCFFFCFFFLNLLVRPIRWTVL